MIWRCIVPVSLRDPFRLTTVYVHILVWKRRTSGGAFYDHSARYGAFQKENRITLRQNMFPETMPREKMPYEDDSVVEERDTFYDEERRIFDELVGRSFLDLPMIALSNGQTRLARVLKAMMAKPKPECYFSMSLSVRLCGLFLSYFLRVNALSNWPRH
ncbi:hypothetical protein K435DRAFT_457437 [Dendrothele bispora CBS 962.96]|uniref:Uncharacterized protein n=1 Tax=Dendrothele bispora (strain CBS 962.96) TaxID=1314807 RepID=A0A4S8L2S8_DENBC|nr:hypothetical protein K435DRAFT_457437 [Dendrothele bispora CBS 962.96]